jgi:four helix bundle protein
MSRHAESFRDLEVYKKACRTAEKIFQLSESFPKEETYSLTDQIRRSAWSVGAHVAEAWGRRRYRRDFVRRLAGADSEQHEAQHWIHAAAVCGYISGAQEEELTGELAEIGRMLHGMMRKAHRFCRPTQATED